MSNDKVRAAAQVVLDTCPLHLMPTREAAGAIGALRDALAEVDAKVEPVAVPREPTEAMLAIGELCLGPKATWYEMHDAYTKEIPI